MSFAGKVWRLLVGVKDGLSLLFLLLFFSLLFATLSLRPSEDAVRKGALLLELDGTVVEEVSRINPLELLLSSAVPAREYAERDIVRAIDTAAGDSRITAIALDMTKFLGGGQVHMEAIGSALDRFRATGKPVLAYAVAYSDDSILLASHASEAWIDPLGGAVLTGPGGERLYYAGLLERLKVNAHVYRVGTYKSAVEPFMLTGMSPDARENAEQLYGALWGQWQENVKRGRPQANIALATLDIPRLITESGGDGARAAMLAGLVTKVGTREQWGERMAELVGPAPFDALPGSFAHTAYSPWLREIDGVAAPFGESREPFGRGGARIGVITVAGEISDGNAGPGEAGGERIARLLDDALDDDLSALVVRVDSPGGTVTGSETIRRAIERHKARGVPIVVSMANVAASGGYWVSTPADRIFAEPATVTGSIGIFGVVPTFENTLAEVGVTSDGVRTTPLSGQPDLLAGLTPDADALLQSTITFGYERFLRLVQQSRGFSREQADAVGQGRVWDGGSARQLGLVDQFGGLDDAMAWAAAQAGLEQGAWEPVFLGQAEPLYAPFLMQMLWPADSTDGARDAFALVAQQQQVLAARALGDLETLFQVRGAQARCLECPATGSEIAPSANLGRAGLLELLGRFIPG